MGIERTLQNAGGNHSIQYSQNVFGRRTIYLTFLTFVFVWRGGLVGFPYYKLFLDVLLLFALQPNKADK